MTDLIDRIESANGPSRRFTNHAFLCKAIADLQSADRGHYAPVHILHEYVAREAGLVWDDKRALFWVLHPDGPQVATWLMDTAMMFEPNEQGAAWFIQAIKDEKVGKVPPS